MSRSGPVWIVRGSGSAAPRARLFCFPFAGGGGAVYRRWPALFPPDIEVCAMQPAGRGSRFAEPPAVSVREIVGDAVDAMHSLLGRPYVLFGHSLGAIVAFESARELRRRGSPMPSGLIVAACGAPRQLRMPHGVAALPDRDFVESVGTRYGGIPPEIAGNDELLELVLPALRADVRAAEEYRWSPELPLDCDIRCFAGAADATVDRAALEGWRAETTKHFAVATFSGGHFFLESDQEAVIGELISLIGELGGSGVIPA